MSIRADGLWAGNQASYDKWVANDAMVDEKLMAYTPGQDEEEGDGHPYLFEKQGSVAVISVKGPLTNRDSWVNQLFGFTSYGAIREALVYAAEDPEVTDILMDMDTPGGSVKGCMDTGDLIKLIDTKVKPVWAFAELAASAGYWLASSARKIYATKSSDIGSIGVIAVHMERSKQLKADGIGVTVIRSGQYKALANGVEPLTDVAKIQLQSQLDAAYKLFVEHVADARGVPYDYCDKNMAEGREFFGEQALAAGLVDEIITYDALMESLLAKSIDTSANSMNNRGNTMQGGVMKRTLSTEQIAAAAAEGVVLAASVEVTDPAVAAAAEAAEAAADTTGPTELAGASQDGTASAAASESVAGDNAAVVTLLQGQLAQAQTDLLAAKVDASKLQDMMAAMQATTEPLLDIARKSINNMRVALAMSPVDTSAMAPAAVLAEHTSISASFKAAMPVGGVAAVDTTEVKKAAAVDPRQVARVNAVFGKTK